ncbi:hypothetical protein [Arthrobacter sp. TB 23]|uniref:hypothetical protein n=1 Tax=Arthrobacter sp. TB 23 TaxID=494419 RepID=UPI0002F74972|nr:hypothetical protein [Arthrobacter sp. TB 23]
MAKSIWIPTVTATGLLALAVAAPSVAAGPPSGPDSASSEAATENHHGMGDQDSVPGMAKMHELMTKDNPGMARMHELMIADNPGMERMHEQMMDADTEMDPNKMMSSDSIPESEGKL